MVNVEKFKTIYGAMHHVGKSKHWIFNSNSTHDPTRRNCWRHITRLSFYFFTAPVRSLICRFWHIRIIHLPVIFMAKILQQAVDRLRGETTFG